MKNTNKILSGILAASIMFGTTSCGDDFLKENANHTTTDALLETGAGALAMAAGLMVTCVGTLDTNGLMPLHFMVVMNFQWDQMKLRLDGWTIIRLK